MSKLVLGAKKRGMIGVITGDTRTFNNGSFLGPLIAVVIR